MTQLRQSRWVSATIAAVIAMAWLGASNHCALAAVERAAKAAHACCHESDQGQPQQAPKSTQCCEAFSVPLPDQAAAPVAHLHELQPAWVESSAPQPVNRCAACREFHDTGPPGAASFAETVLNRSLLAHAPPFFVS